MGQRPSEEEMKRRRRPLLQLIAERLVEDYLVEIGELPPRAAPETPKETQHHRSQTINWTPSMLAAFHNCKLSVDDIIARQMPIAELPLPRTKRPIKGCYFLIAWNRIMYVGSTSNLRERMNQHAKRPFTHFAWIEAPRFYRTLEAYYINQLAPPWNSNYPTDPLAAPSPNAENAPDARSTVRTLFDRPAAADVD